MSFLSCGVSEIAIRRIYAMANGWSSPAVVCLPLPVTVVVAENWRFSRAPFVLHSHGLIRQVRKCHAFLYAEQHAIHAISIIYDLWPFPQAGRRGFDPRLPLFSINKLRKPVLEAVRA